MRKYMGKFIRNIYICLAFTALVPTASNAQEWLGYTNSNYAGVGGLMLNPSSIVLSRLYFDVNIIGGDFFVQNNYAYYPSFIKKDSESDVQNASDGNGGLKDYYTVNPDKSAYMNMRFNLPSVMWGNNRRAFAISLSQRNNMNLDDMPYHLAKFAFESTHFKYSPQQGINYLGGPFTMRHLSWFEIGGSFAYRLTNTPSSTSSIGITAKYNIGLLSFYVDSRMIDYQVDSNNIDPAKVHADMAISRIDLQYGHAMSGTNSFVPGQGVGLDIGYTFMKKPSRGFEGFYSKPKYDKYLYKIGLSLLDFGILRFKGPNSSVHTFRNLDASQPGLWTKIDTFDFKFSADLHELDEGISRVVYNDPIVSLSDEAFVMGLPTAISAQFDFNLGHNFFVNTLGVYPIQLAPYSITRPSIISTGIRYETRSFEAAIPYSLYNFTGHRLGLMLRLGPLVLGTDKLGAFVRLNDVTGADIYFALKFSISKERLPGLDPTACYYKSHNGKKAKKKRRVIKSPVLKF